MNCNRHVLACFLCHSRDLNSKVSESCLKGEVEAHNYLSESILGYIETAFGKQLGVHFVLFVVRFVYLMERKCFDGNFDEFSRILSFIQYFE